MLSSDVDASALSDLFFVSRACDIHIKCSRMLRLTATSVLLFNGNQTRARYAFRFVPGGKRSALAARRSRGQGRSFRASLERCAQNSGRSSDFLQDSSKSTDSPLSLANFPGGHAKRVIANLAPENGPPWPRLASPRIAHRGIDGVSVVK